MKHTKGPWRLGKYITRSYWRSVWGPDSVIVCEVSGSAHDRDRSEANLNLILAAPDILEALEELVDIIDNEGKIDSFTTQSAVKAIAKAKGE